MVLFTGRIKSVDDCFYNPAASIIDICYVKATLEDVHQTTRVSDTDRDHPPELEVDATWGKSYNVRAVKIAESTYSAENRTIEVYLYLDGHVLDQIPECLGKAVNG
ncbi:hypothetical protein N7451_012541 [Penicillium sp. IBT 35674x]|nr:hypothetical protein N7451_012541 [Penicillium sp. IBT 35674x]